MTNAGNVRADAANGKRELFAPGTLAWDPVARVPAIEDRLVTAAFHFLTDPKGLTPDKARELGRALGRQAGVEDLHAFTDGFSHLGLGQLRLANEAPDRLVFESPDLRGGAHPNAASCALALGFAEGASQRSRGPHVLGAETRCRSRGHSTCTFVVMAKR